jgi:hypothetical protein
VLQVHVFVPGPVPAQVAWGSQPPFPELHESTAVQVIPFPWYPVLHAQLTVPAPVDVQCAVGAQPPLFTAQPFVPTHVIPLPP